VKFPASVTTCPSRAVEVSEVLSFVVVPVKTRVVIGLKQIEPLTCSAPLTAEPVWLMLPAKVSGGFPVTVDTALNCQLPTTGVVGAGVAGVGAVVDVEGELVGAGAGAALHPKRRIVAERAAMVARCFMELPPLLLPGGGRMERYGANRTPWLMVVSRGKGAEVQQISGLPSNTVFCRGFARQRYNLVPGFVKNAAPTRRALWANHPLVHR